MIVFNEGTPGSGKSYDAVVTHILPALAKKRKVFARLNGLEGDPWRANIAAYLKIEPAELDALLVHLTDDDVKVIHEDFERLRDALVVIDEAHMFWDKDQKTMPKDAERFFAEHRHFGLDIVLISQFYKRVHTAVRYRVERKVAFQKLSAVGMDGRYNARYYDSIMPDKYQPNGTKVFKYDRAIFPLYRSVQQGTENLEVYKAGGRSVFQRLAIPAAVMLVLAICAGLFLISFFSGNSSLVKDDKSLTAPVREVAAPSRGVGPPEGVKPAGVVVGTPVEPVRPAGVQYVFDLAKKGRARVSGVFEGSKRRVVVVEWRDEGGRVMERLTNFELRDLGIVVSSTRYGAKLRWQEEVIVATQYPLFEEPGRTQTQRLEATRYSGGVSAPSASFASGRSASRSAAPGGSSASSSSRSIAEPLQWPKEAIP